MSFDLADIDLKADSEAGSWLHLKDPRLAPSYSKDGKPDYSRCYLYEEGDKSKPLRLMVLGPHAEVVKVAADKVNKAKAKREAERTVRDDKGNVITVGESTPEELKQDDIEVYTAAITGWDNIAFGGEEKFSKKVVKKLLEAKDWLRPQVFAWVFNQENFIQGREKS